MLAPLAVKVAVLPIQTDGELTIIAGKEFTVIVVVFVAEHPFKVPLTV